MGWVKGPMVDFITYGEKNKEREFKLPAFIYRLGKVLFNIYNTCKIINVLKANASKGFEKAINYI